MAKPPNDSNTDAQLVAHLTKCLTRRPELLTGWEVKFASSLQCKLEQARDGLVLTPTQRQKAREIISDFSAREKIMPSGGPKNVSPRSLPQAPQEEEKTSEPEKLEVEQPPEIHLGLINAKQDVQLMTEQIRKSGVMDATFMFFGPSGTGKSILAKHIVSKMGLPCRKVRASDIMDKFVGQTEKAICRAFTEARDGEYALIFDEVDSLLFSREMARQQWETSMVNELLVQLEQHPLPVFCTTNCFDKVDVAVRRRMLFKVEFDYLASDQARNAFEWFFEISAPKSLTKLKCLTAADFDVARRKARVLGLLEDPGALLGLLQEEVADKPDALAEKPIGFQPPQ